MSELELRDVKVEFSGGMVSFTSRLQLNDGTPASRPSGKYEAMVFEDGRWRFRVCLVLAATFANRVALDLR